MFKANHSGNLMLVQDFGGESQLKGESMSASSQEDENENGGDDLFEGTQFATKRKLDLAFTLNNVWTYRKERNLHCPMIFDDI